MTGEPTGLADYDRAIFQALVNEGKHLKALSARKPALLYNEKELRDAAHAEVAHSTGHEFDETHDKISRKRKNLNADEKARQSRDRNREHAKNTRLRKKAYVVKLKELVDDMTRQKNLEEQERRNFGERILTNDASKRQSVLLFLSYRASNCQDASKWENIMDNDFSFALPITPYRTFLKADVRGSSRVLSGVEGMMRDAASIMLMVQNIGQGTEAWRDALLNNGDDCKFTYHVARDDILVAGDLVMCRYLLKIDVSRRLGGDLQACYQPGMLQCKFNPSTNKLSHVDMVFDVMGFMQQLQRTGAILPEHSIVPNTLEMALQPSNEPRAVMKAVGGSFAMLHVNLAWTQLTGLPQSEAEGRSFQNFANMFTPTVDILMAVANGCTAGKAGSALVPLHAMRNTQSQTQQLGYIKMIPLSADLENASHILVIFLVVDEPQTKESSR
eukprot:gene5889-6484_t